MSSSVLSVLHVWSHSIFTALRNGCYYYSHFTVDEIKNNCPPFTLNHHCVLPPHIQMPITKMSKVLQAS